ncbi:dTDP-4-dehydrorhamnose reductase [bacterium]|nr:dTDP-4-dehydrorhamnose reductase [bacterium]
MDCQKILIIGSEGQLGQEFVNYLDEKQVQYFAPKEKDCNITDVEQLTDLFTKYQPKFVINCAAYNAVEAAEENHEIAYLINSRAVETIAGLCNQYGCKLVHYSSDYVFDGTKQDLYNEDDPTSPLNIYGKSKLEGEEIALCSNPEFLVFRLSWVIGRGQQNFLHKLGEWAKTKRVLTISADEVSIPTFTDDIVKLTLESLEKDLKGLYHMTSSQYASRYELARFYIDYFNLDNIVIPVPMSNFKTKALRPVFSPMSNLKLESALNIKIPDWKDSFCRFFG